MLFFKSYFKANCVNQKSKAAEISHAISECTMTFIGQHNLKSPTFLNTHVQLHSIFASHLFFFFFTTNSILKIKHNSVAILQSEQQLPKRLDSALVAAISHD